MEDLQLGEVCRLCLTKHEDMQLAIEVGVIDRLMDCVLVELPSDSLICNFCESEVNKWYSFKQQVLKSLEVAKYIETSKKKRSVPENNYVVIEECFLKTEIEDEIDVKPDVSQINFINEEHSEVNNEEMTQTLKSESCNIFNSLTGCSNHNRKLHNNKIKSEVSSPDVSEDEDSKPLLQEKYQCDLCHKSFISKLGMIWHKQLHSALKLDSSKGGSPLFSCPHCPMTYEKKISLIDHMKWKHFYLMKRNAQIYICDFCGKYCKSKSEFRAHSKTHKGEKQFKCEVCNKSFVTVSNLVAHRSIHTDNDAPFTCARCGRSFRKQSYLLSHQATHERPYKCHKCSKTFGKKYAMKKHMENH